MTFVKIICTTILCLLLTNSAKAQVSRYVKIHEEQFKPLNTEVDYSIFKSRDNELKQVVSAMFMFYKEFVSSQDQNTCVFTPSCSVYAMQSISKYGVIRGSLSAFDRLTRCHPLITNEYPIDNTTQKYYDPVK